MTRYEPDPGSAGRRPACSKRIFCGIAQRVVRAAWRHGRGLGEPGHSYVRCDERDCQYVDLNQPPCPLNVEMFRGGDDVVIHATLTGLARHAICYGCLARNLDLPHERIRYAVWRLLDRPGLAIDVKSGRCATCRRRSITVELISEDDAPEAAEDTALVAAPDEPPVDDVVATLLGAPATVRCASCLAFASRRSLAEARQIVHALRHDDRFASRDAECARCGRRERVLAVVRASERFAST